METSSHSNKRASTGVIVGLIIVVLVAGLAYIFVLSSNKKNEIVAQSPTPQNPVTATPETNGENTHGTMMSGGSMHSGGGMMGNIYKNGIYTAVGDYNSPGGSEQISVTLTLIDDVVTNATVVAGATRPQTQYFQEMFVANFKSQVVGKKINTLSLDRVSGSSLTPEGFNNAVAKIKTEAKA